MTRILLTCTLLSLLSACTNYGKKVSSSNIDVYYKEGITAEQAEKTARLFDATLAASNPADEGTKSFQLQQNGDTILLKMVADLVKADAVGDAPFYAICTLVSDSVFAGQPVNLTLTDNRFKELRAYRFRKELAPAWGEKTVSGNVEVYDQTQNKEMADALALFLETYMSPEKTISFQLTKNEQGTLLVNMVIDPAKSDRFTPEVMEEISGKISGSVCKGAPVIFQVTDDTFSVLRSQTRAGQN